MSETAPDIPSHKDKIQLLLLDCDGVLTDGGVTWSEDGIEHKTFNIRDGLGIKLWQQAGFQVGIVTGRSSHVVQWRSNELGVNFVRQGIRDKVKAVSELLALCHLGWDSLAYIGDDLPDLSVIQRAGFGVAVADACQEVKEVSDFTTQLPGGKGAVRETVEVLLRSRGCWENLVLHYQGNGIA
jgi:YrbI family 3-deoxy-D-manno-octulosonate 8-phosphate phosphatase